MNQSLRVKVLLFVLVVVLLGTLFLKISNQKNQPAAQIQTSFPTQKATKNLKQDDVKQSSTSLLGPYVNTSKDEIDFLKKNKISLLKKQNCFPSKEAFEKREVSFCIGCNSTECKEAKDLYSIEEDGRVLKMNGNLSEKNKYYFEPYQHDGDLPEDESSVILYEIENPNPRSIYVIAGNNLEPILKEIKYYKSTPVDKEPTKPFPCKPHDGYRSMGTPDIQTDEFTKRKYYFWEQAIKDGTSADGTGSTLTTNGELKDDGTCIEWFRGVADGFGMNTESGLDSIENRLLISGVLKLGDEKFFLFDTSGYEDMSGSGLALYDEKENKFIILEKYIH